MNHIRSRFAPSPTGSLHIGGARTALYAYLWAKHNKGDFILRIEDTDKVREVEGSIDEIMDGLRWIGIDWTEGPDVGGEFGPYKQSERLELYKKSIQVLLDSGHAYYCFCTTERLQEMRKQQQAEKKQPKYDRFCRTLSAEEIQSRISSGEKNVVRMLIPDGEIVEVEDTVRGTMKFQTDTIDDQILMKADGYPTYHFANVVDDHDMQITSVIRGEEWLPSTPKHVLLYKAFGWDAPTFTHLTVFLSKGGGKMSKRDGETALLAFRDLGYLPEAVVNFQALLGWNPKTEEEFFTLEELIQRFDIHMINAGNPIFETEKLDWMNHHYLRQLSATEMLERIRLCAAVCKNPEYLSLYTKFVQWFSSLSLEKQTLIWKSVQERCKTLLQVAESITVIDELPDYDAGLVVWKKSTPEGSIAALTAVRAQFEALDADTEYVAEIMQPRIIEWISTTEWGNGDVLWPVRYALSGQAQSPSPFELAEILGKELVLSRIDIALQKLAAL